MKNKYTFILTNCHMDPKIYAKKNNSNNYFYVGSYNDAIQLICDLESKENNILINFRNFSRVSIANIIYNSTEMINNKKRKNSIKKQIKSIKN